MFTHNMFMKIGGTSEVEIKSITFREGKPIFAMGKANGKFIDPTPIGKIDGSLTFQTPNQNSLTSTQPRGNQKPSTTMQQANTPSKSTPKNNKVLTQKINLQQIFHFNFADYLFQP